MQALVRPGHASDVTFRAGCVLAMPCKAAGSQDLLVLMRAAPAALGTPFWHSWRPSTHQGGIDNPVGFPGALYCAPQRPTSLSQARRRKAPRQHVKHPARSVACGSRAHSACWERPRPLPPSCRPCSFGLPLPRAAIARMRPIRRQRRLPALFTPPAQVPPPPHRAASALEPCPASLPLPCSVRGQL